MATPARVLKLLDKGRATLGECANAANGKVMCTVDRRGSLANIVVPENYITKRLGKGDTLGECGGGSLPGGTPTPAPTAPPGPTATPPPAP